MSMPGDAMRRGLAIGPLSVLAGKEKTKTHTERNIEMKTLFVLAMALAGLAAASPSFAKLRSQVLRNEGGQVVLTDCQNPFDHRRPSANGG